MSASFVLGRPHQAQSRYQGQKSHRRYY